MAVFRWDEAVAGGVSRHRIANDVDARRARRVLPGVYLDHTGTPTRQEQWDTGLQYAGSDAFLSMWTAAEIHEFGVTWRPEVHVTVPGDPRVPVPGVVYVHRTRDVQPADVTEHCGLPVSTGARTLVDLVGHLPERELRYVVARAVQRLGVRPLDVVEILDRSPRRPHGRRLRDLVEAVGPARSGGEMRLAGAMAERGHPGRVNAVVELRRGLRREGDLVFEEERVVVQVESVAHHSLLPDIEADIARDDDWVRAGWLVVRVSIREIEYDVDRACDRVIAALRHRRSAA